MKGLRLPRAELQRSERLRKASLSSATSSKNPACGERFCLWVCLYLCQTFPWLVLGRIRQGGRDTRWGSCDVGSPEHDGDRWSYWWSLIILRIPNLVWIQVSNENDYEDGEAKHSPLSLSLSLMTVTPISRSVGDTKAVSAAYENSIPITAAEICNTFFDISLIFLFISSIFLFISFMRIQSPSLPYPRYRLYSTLVSSIRDFLR